MFKQRSEIESNLCFFFSSRRRHTRFDCDWSSDVCSSDLTTCIWCLHPRLPCPRCRGSDRKSTRLNSSHSQISYAVFCLKKKKKKKQHIYIKKKKKKNQNKIKKKTTI